MSDLSAEIGGSIDQPLTHVLTETVANGENLFRLALWQFLREFSEPAFAIAKIVHLRHHSELMVNSPRWMK